jgi:hypothetical protein
LCITQDPGVRLRQIAATLGVTERSAYGTVADLAEAGYIVKQRDRRRNRYDIQHGLPLREATSRERTIGDVLDVLVALPIRHRGSRPGRWKTERDPRPLADPARDEGEAERAYPTRQSGSQPGSTVAP